MVKKLVYGYAKLHDCLAFAAGDTAAAEAREIVAIASARTWGEARRVVVRHTWNPAPDDDDPGEPTDDAPFVIGDVGSVADGDWPPMVTSRAFDLLPADLQKRFGTAGATALNGDCLEIPVSAEGELIAELRERGYAVIRDDDLINTLAGGTFLD